MTEHSREQRVRPLAGTRSSTRRFAVITVVALLFAPVLYWNGEVKFYDNSQQPNPQRAMFALMPFALGLLGTVVDWFEHRPKKRG